MDGQVRLRGERGDFRVARRLGRGIFRRAGLFRPERQDRKARPARAGEEIHPTRRQLPGRRLRAAARKGVKKLDAEQSWSWIQNPFIGTKELNGLKVIMMLVSNWDNKDVRDVKRGSNTAIFQTKTGIGLEDRYLVTDWGGSMGKWGGYITREKWDCKGFHSQTKDFVKGVKGDQVEFGYSGQHSDSFKGGIRVSDVQWVAQYLGRINDDQLRAGLQASGAKGEEVECFAKSLRDRINQLKNAAR